MFSIDREDIDYNIDNNSANDLSSKGNDNDDDSHSYPYLGQSNKVSLSIFSGEFRVCADTQMVQQDIEPGIHVYVHYFTLYDVRARGFVRPMCLSYISSDSRKLLHYFSHLRLLFSKVSHFMLYF